MISKFNKDGAAALYGRQFAECIEDYDYDGAADKLLKYNEAADFDRFHLVFGMLYMMMTQDSDEEELLVLAYREFMMHLCVYPDCREAYRNLIGVMCLRHDSVGIAETLKFVEENGFEPKEMLDELTAVGLVFYYDPNDPIDYDTLFPPEEYGSIMASAMRPKNNRPPFEEAPKPAPALKGSKVIGFRGAKSPESADRSAAETGTGESKVLPIMAEDEKDPPDISEIFDITDGEEEEQDDESDARGEELARLLMDLVLSENDDEIDADYLIENIDDVFGRGEDVSKDELKSKFAIRASERLCAAGKFDEALEKLDSIPKNGSRMQYCAECARAHIHLVRKDLDSAEQSLGEAKRIYENGALVGTMLCILYEARGETARIPAVLKGIDVFDFTDGDHVYSALQYAIDYCSPDDALALAESYVDEFNTFDLRLLYAQLLYNSGDRDGAKRELYDLTRVLYDDFVVVYFYTIACDGVPRMPLETDAPGEFLDAIVGHFISMVNSPEYGRTSEDEDDGIFDYCLEMFLTLEYRNKKSVLKTMFDTLKKLANDKRIEGQMRNALVSPYTEPIVKAVILSELLANGSKNFMLCSALHPVSQAGVPKLAKGCPREFYLAYSLALVFCRSEIHTVIDLARKISKIDVGANGGARKACYIWTEVQKAAKCTDKEADGRIYSLFGYSSKTAALSDCKALKAKFDSLK